MYKRQLYAIARNHYVLITTEDGEYRAMCSFAQIEEKLTALENFMSCKMCIRDRTYSLTYNGSYMLPETLLTMVAAVLLCRVAPQIFDRQAR